MLSISNNARTINNETDERFLKWPSKDFCECQISKIIEPLNYVSFKEHITNVEGMTS